MIPRKVIAGYADRLSVAAGESLDFKVSVEAEVDFYRCDIVRLVCTDEHRDGPGLVETVVDTPVNRNWPARRQSIHMGSYARVPAMSALESFTLQAWIWPTRPRGRQAIIAQGTALAMELDETGALVLELDGERFGTGCPLLEREWVFVAASYDAASGTLRLIQSPIRRYPGFDSTADMRFEARSGGRVEGDVTIAATGTGAKRDGTSLQRKDRPAADCGPRPPTNGDGGRSGRPCRRRRSPHPLSGSGTLRAKHRARASSTSRAGAGTGSW